MKRLIYKCSLRINDENKNIKFFEILKESEAGVSVGSEDDNFGPGFGFKTEKIKIGQGSREGTIYKNNLTYLERNINIIFLMKK